MFKNFLFVVLTLDQRFKDTALQPAKEKELYPSHRHLKVRRSQRCKVCFDYTITSISRSLSNKNKIPSPRNVIEYVLFRKKDMRNMLA